MCAKRLGPAKLLPGVIAASPELQERELAKRANLGNLISAALRDRGTAESAAIVAAWTAVACSSSRAITGTRPPTGRRWPS